MLVGRIRQGILRNGHVALIRYVGASVVALGSDMGLFLILLGSGWASVPASVFSYMLGIIVHWLISSRFVFSDGARTTGARRFQQKALFMGSALVGLALTVAVISIGEVAGLDGRLSKLVAVGVAFVATYALRKTIVFNPSAA
jgi:putative flippase GtrA